MTRRRDGVWTRKGVERIKVARDEPIAGITWGTGE